MQASRSIAALAAVIFAFAQSSAIAQPVPSPSPSSSPPATATAPPSSNVEPQIETLGNGLRVVVLEDHKAPLAHVATYYRFGAAYETKGKTGLAHALEHMMFRGTPSLSAAGLDDVDAQLGADVNATTTNETTTFYFVVPADRVGLALNIEADRMQHLSLNPSDWNVERQAVLHEWDGDHANSFVSLFFDVNRAIYPNSALGKPAFGERDDIERATVADIRNYYRTWYAPNNATIVVTGDVKPADVFVAAESAFGAVPRKTLPPSPIAVPVAAHGATVRENSVFPIEIDDVAYALPGNSAGTEGDFERTSIVAAAIDNPRSPFRAALVDSGVTLGYFVYPAFDRHVGVAHALLVVTPGHTGDEARAVFTKTLADMLEKGVPQELFDAVKLQRLAGLELAKDSLSSYAQVGGAYAYAGDGTITQARQYLTNLTVDDVNVAARKYFAEPSAIGIVSPQGRDLSKFKPPSSLSGEINDSFSNRVPAGKVVEPPQIRESLTKPLAFANTIDPSSFTLPNGVRVLVQEDHTNPTVYVAGSMASSPAFQPAGKEGVAEILNGALSFGSAHYDFAEQHAAGDRLGAIVRFGTSFSAHGYAKDLDAFLDAFADDLQRPALPEQRLALLRAQSAAAYKALDVVAPFRARSTFDKLLYPAGDPALRVTTATSAAAITSDDVRTYAAQYLRPDLLTIAVVGDVSVDSVRASITKAFGDWTVPGPRPDLVLPAVPKPKAARKLVHSLGVGLSVELGQVAVPLSSPDYDTFALMNSIFGNGSFDSRLFRELREKRGLVYSVASILTPDVDRSTLKISFSTNAGDEEEAIAGVRGEMLRLQREPVTPVELARGRLKSISSTLITEQSSDSIAGDLLAIAKLGLPLDYYGTLDQRLGHITAADIQRVAKADLFPLDLIEVRTGP